jgi:hypothetical protein
MKYEVKQNIWIIKISKYKNEYSKYSIYQDGITVDKTEILGISDYKIVFKDSFFTTVDNDDREDYRKDRKYNRYIDDIDVSIRVSGFLEPGVFVSLYSTKQPDKKLLQKMVKEAEKVINKEYGFLFGGVVKELNQFVENFDILRKKE